MIRLLLVVALLCAAWAAPAAVTRCEGHYTYIGLDADTKPTAPQVCDRFKESDTGDTFIWSGSAWVADNLPVSQATVTSGENQTLNTVETSVAGPGSSATANITTATSTEVCDPTGAGASEMVGFYVNSTSSGTIRFFDDADGTCSSSAKGGVITPAVGWHWYPVPFTTAICVLTASTIDVTVEYRCAD